LKEKLRDEMFKAENKDNAQVLKMGRQKDPILQLGFGINAYLSIKFELIIVFILFTLLATPSYIYYGAQNGYSDVEITGNESMSLGNLGYSSVHCVQRKLETGMMSL
jgi:hypothetical protein